MAIKLPKGFCKACGAILPGQGKWCDLHRPRPKYGNKKVGAVASKREHSRGFTLANLQRSGHVRNLKAQVRFKLVVNGQLICTYVADFTYEIFTDAGWLFVVEDTKGYRTRYYKTVARLFLALHGFAITET